MKLRQATIDLPAIVHNYKQVKRLAPDSKVLAMIKSDAYGHGLLPVARVLPEVDAFGISVIEEALALREGGVKQRLVLMTGVSDMDELRLCVQHDIDLVVHTYDQVCMLQALSGQALLNVWLKLDVAMHRLGFKPEDFMAVYHQLSLIEAVRQPVIVMSHLPCADMIGDADTAIHIDTVLEVARSLNNPLSVAKSAGILAYPQAHLDWVRPGIMLYGISPFPGHVGAQHQLKPAMMFTAKVVSVRQLKAGEAVSYGATWRCPENMTIAIVGVGYSDGYPRHAKSGTPILVNDQLCQIVGRVCMDMLSVDCRACPEVAVGDSVTLWGGALPIEHVATGADTIAYELACHVSDRVKVFKGE